MTYVGKSSPAQGTRTCDVCGAQVDQQHEVGWYCFCSVEGALGAPQQEAGFVCGTCVVHYATAQGIDVGTFWTAYCQEKVRRQARLALDAAESSKPRSLCEVHSEPDEAGEGTGRVPHF